MILKIKEWTSEKKWNPFNSYKLLSQVYRWRQIRKNNSLPQPATISVDPINVCDLKCVWCNANSILEKNDNMISRRSLLNIADFIAYWQGSKKWEKGVESVCIGGGGEALLNPHTGEFIEKCIQLGVEVGIVTNGTNIDKFIKPLSKCNWVGVSVDAGSPETFKELKGINYFNKIIKNIKSLIEFSNENDTVLSKPSQGYGVSYKYLLHPKNVCEVFTSAKIAKSIGCKNFHMRPVSIPWNKLNGPNTNMIQVKDDFIKEFRKQTKKARNLEDSRFGVFGITHKFDNKFNIANCFKKCYAIFMTGVIMPSQSKDNNKFNFGLCCDRRGDENLILGRNLNDANEIAKLWGNKEHWEIIDKINVKTCPRCTYQPHNQIYEHVILNDSMTYKFI